MDDEMMAALKTWKWKWLPLSALEVQTIYSLFPFVYCDFIHMFKM